MPINYEMLKEKYKVTDKEIEDYITSHKLNVANNPNLRLIVYLSSKGITSFEEPQSSLYKKVSELTKKEEQSPSFKGENVRLNVVAKLKETAYIGCPYCWKRLADATLEDEGEEKICRNEKCKYYGKEVTATLHYSTRYLAGDETGEVVIQVPPFIKNVDILNKWIDAWGRLDERGIFNLANFKIVEDLTEEQKEGKKESKSSKSSLPSKPSTKTSETLASNETTVVVDEKMYEVAVKQFTRVLRLYGGSWAETEAKEWLKGRYENLDSDEILKRANVTIADGVIQLKEE